MFAKTFYRDRLQRLWQALVDPPPDLKDPVRRHQIRLLNGILVVFIPLALVILLIQMIVLPITDIYQSTTIKAIVMGVGVALLIYLVNHTKHYRLGRVFTIFIGFVAVIVNAIASDAPHVEIAYLVMLPLVGTLLLSLAETIVVYGFTILVFVTFVVVMGDVPTDLIKDLLTFLIFVEVFILFLNQQRNHLEIDRQKLAVEQGRNVLLKQLIANLSHDFRTPLSVIITSVYLLSRIKDPTQQQEKLDQIHRQAMRLNRLIDDILTMTALNQGTDQSLERRTVNDLLQTLHREFLPQAEQKSLQLQLDLAEDLVSILMNVDTLRLGLTHLVENAISYTEPGGQVVLRSFMDHAQVVVEITDTGIGMAPQYLQDIFMPFFRADPARPTETGGMGLGLAIAQKVVELHGGTITAESVVGHSSTFRVRLPVN